MNTLVKSLASEVPQPKTKKIEVAGFVIGEDAANTEENSLPCWEKMSPALASEGVQPLAMYSGEMWRAKCRELNYVRLEHLHKRGITRASYELTNECSNLATGLIGAFFHAFLGLAVLGVLSTWFEIPIFLMLLLPILAAGNGIAIYYWEKYNYSRELTAGLAVILLPWFTGGMFSYATDATNALGAVGVGFMYAVLAIIAEASYCGTIDERRYQRRKIGGMIAKLLSRKKVLQLLFPDYKDQSWDFATASNYDDLVDIKFPDLELESSFAKVLNILHKKELQPMIAVPVEFFEPNFQDLPAGRLPSLEVAPQNGEEELVCYIEEWVSGKGPFVAVLADFAQEDEATKCARLPEPAQ